MSIAITAVCSAVVYIALSQVLFTSDGLSRLSPSEIQSFQRSFRFSFIWTLLLLVLAFGLESMFRFHRLIGPIYVIEKMIKTIASGDLTQEFRLRKRDELKDLINELAAMREGLRNFVMSDRKAGEKINAKLDRLLKSIDNGSTPADLRKEIEEARNEISLISSHFKI